MGVIHIATTAGPGRRDETKARVRFVAAGVVLILGLVGGGLAPNWFAVLLAVIIVTQVFIDFALEPGEAPTVTAGVEMNVADIADEADEQ